MPSVSSKVRIARRRVDGPGGCQVVCRDGQDQSVLECPAEAAKRRMVRKQKVYPTLLSSRAITAGLTVMDQAKGDTEYSLDLEQNRLRSWPRRNAILVDVVQREGETRSTSLREQPVGQRRAHQGKFPDGEEEIS